MESSLIDLERELQDLQHTAVTGDGVREGLRQFERVFVHLQPHEQKQLVRLVLRRAEVWTGS